MPRHGIRTRGHHGARLSPDGLLPYPCYEATRRTFPKLLIVAHAACGVAAPAAAYAQQSVLRPYVIVGRKYEHSATRDSTVLRYACGDTTHPTLKAGDVVTWAESLGGKSVTYTRKLDATPYVPVEPKPVPKALQRMRANVAVDEGDPSVLRVNPWRYSGDSVVFRNGTDTLSMSAAEFNTCRFSYKLANRVSLPFPYRSLTVGPAVIPFRVRRRYTAATTGAVVDGEVSSQTSVGVYAGGTFGRSRYFYAKDGDNVVREPWKFTAAAFLAFSQGSADSASTLSSLDGLRGGRTASFLNVSPGLAALANVKGVDVGLFGGQERAMLGSADARKWDRHKKWWWGVGFGYQLFK